MVRRTRTLRSKSVSVAGIVESFLRVRTEEREGERGEFAVCMCLPRIDLSGGQFKKLNFSFSTLKKNNKKKRKRKNLQTDLDLFELRLLELQQLFRITCGQFYVLFFGFIQYFCLISCCLLMGCFRKGVSVSDVALFHLLGGN